MFQRKTRKAQSAMEYLMTYGWAILIIAVVLGALFSLGVFSGKGQLGTVCIAFAGFSCQSPTYDHTSGNLIVTIGQNTGTNWVTANIVFVPQGTATSSGIPSVTWVGANANPQSDAGSANAEYAGTEIYSGQTLTMYLPASAASTSVGTTISGSIWVQYTTSSGGTLYYTQIAQVTAKAV